MGRSTLRLCIIAALLGTTALPVAAQQTDPAATQSTETAVLTAEELQKLVAPVALYPDTLLIQVLIAAAAPLDVVKADRLLSDNPETPKAELEQKIKDAHYDPSVEVLALGFPTLIRQMAVHIDWTETVGTAMLAQSDDVMAAVQVMRAQAINTGALATSPEMVVSEDAATNTVVIQPADPQVIYVPQYEPATVYTNPVGDALAAGLIIFGTVALIDEIFDDNDDWNGYWGCRNCAGWDNGTIVRNPDVDIDFNGNVNIGNDINAAWRPDNDRVAAAHNKIAVNRGANGATTLGLDRPASRTDELRTKLGAGSASAGNLTGAAAGQNLGAERLNLDRPAASNLSARTPNAKPVASAKTKTKPKASSAAARPSKPKVAKTGTASSTRAASSRGRTSATRARR